MHHSSGILAVTGSLCLTIAIVLAWCLVGVRAAAFINKVFRNYQQALRRRTCPIGVHRHSTSHCGGVSTLLRPTGKELVRSLKRAGLSTERVRGSHCLLRHADGRATGEFPSLSATVRQEAPIRLDVYVPD